MKLLFSLPRWPKYSNFSSLVITFTLKYADPVLDLLDIHKVIHHRLFRESCSCFKGSYVKDMVSFLFTQSASFFSLICYF